MQNTGKAEDSRKLNLEPGKAGSGFANQLKSWIILANDCPFGRIRYWL